MLVERQDISKVLFSELDEGVVFIHDDIPYMKIKEIGVYDVASQRSHLFNAICLGNGEFELLEVSEQVDARPNSYVVIL